MAATALSASSIFVHDAVELALLVLREAGGLGLGGLRGGTASDVVRSVGRPNKEGKCQLSSGMLVASFREFSADCS